ncbi:ATP-binding protein, partial [Citrobacter freundii]|uniref:ATP-binding protein n=1 Tax=Citrobacter freundii TaxID=546 RepID=UPI002F96777B
LTNASRYPQTGAWVPGRLTAGAGRGHLGVEKPGPPIPPQHLPRLFDRFYRVDPSRQRKGEGSGIGLAIVKSIVIAHHGKVSVTSDPYVTRFILTLPKHAM